MVIIIVILILVFSINRCVIGGSVNDDNIGNECVFSILKGRTPVEEHFADIIDSIY